MTEQAAWVQSAPGCDYGAASAVVAAAFADTAAAITRSFALYWPADAEGRNDAGERNVSIHLAHAFLQRGFGVYAEANHPRPGLIGIDFLAIEPTGAWFCAVECKRIINGKTGSMVDDVRRLREFRLNDALKPRRCGDRVVDLARECRRGVAAVAGLHWVGASGPGGAHRLWTSHGEGSHRGAVGALQDELAAVGARYLAPMAASDWPSGRYDLLAATFPIGRG
jgi:hypothetical protein